MGLRDSGLDLSKIPSSYPPPGVTPNFIDPPFQGDIPKIFAYLTIPPMLILLALRLYKRIKDSLLGSDDYLCILAAATMIGAIVLCFIYVEHGGGRHSWDVPFSILVTPALSGTMIGLYFASAMFVKAAILALYRRIFEPSRIANYLIYAGLIFNVLLYLGSIGVMFGFCAQKGQEFPIGPHCYKADVYVAMATGVGGTLVDLYILILPVFFFWGIQMSGRRKARHLAIFMAGVVACIFSIAGIYYRSKIASTNSRHMDLTWQNMPIFGTSIAEINIGIGCSCMPVAFGLIKSGLSKTASWGSDLWSLGSNKSSQTKSIQSQANSFKGAGEESLLPQTSNVDNSTPMQKLRPSFRRGPKHERTGSGLTIDYHEHLKKDSFTDSDTSLQRPTKAIV